ncbi:hypothetical protein C1646_776343 [Rhizophagus diaphanus]|nr:hypothetical protein C1646_776343 [Rhizophagus diaphanus] [Rhizophagus sp. MUCL 43196]
MADRLFYETKIIRKARKYSIQTKNQVNPDGHRLVEIMLTNNEWNLLSSLCEVLEEFADATEQLGGKEVSDVFEEEREGELAENTQNTPKRRLNINKPLETQNILKKVKLDLYNAMELYWDQKEAEILISVLLDPRIKSLDFVSNEKIHDEAKELLEKKYIELKAQIYLPIPATSTPNERLFSCAENFLTAKRTRLNSELFNRLIFLKKNAPFVENIYPKS